MSYFSDNQEWQWLFNNSIDWDKIIPLYYKEFPTEDGFETKEDLIDFFKELVTSTSDWADNSIAPRAHDLDKAGSGVVKDGVFTYSEPNKQLIEEGKSLEIFGIAAPRELGGLQVPYIVGLLAFQQISRGCMSSGTVIGFHSCIIDMLERFADKEDRDRLIPKVVQAELSGSMNLTEPNAGSDVGSLKATAVKQDDGTYKITGTKCFITNGGGGISFVLARIKGAPEGLPGISLFLIEEWLEDPNNPGEKIHNYQIGKCEEKMGLKGSPTLEVVYENSIGKLIGEEHDGMKPMFHLMNESRISVGLQAISGIEAALHHGREYAEQRVQFGQPITELPLLKKQLGDWETERDAFRAFIADTVSYFDIYQKLHMDKMHSKDLTEEEARAYKQANKIIRRRTPLVKYYGSEAYVDITKKVIQLLGGYGYMKEYDAERHHRDSFGPLLYEGTSQIQSLMAFKDLMKIVMVNPGKYFQSILYPNTLKAGVSDSERKFMSIRDQFKRSFGKLLLKTLRPTVDIKDPLTGVMDLMNVKKWKSRANMEKLMTFAETICQGLSYIETLRVLNQHVAKDSSRKELFDNYRKVIIPRLAAVYAEWEL